MIVRIDTFLSEFTQECIIKSMATYHREQVRELRKRLQEPPRHLIAIFGPRQTGKTTIVRQALEQSEVPSSYLPLDFQEIDSWTVASGAASPTMPAQGEPTPELLRSRWREARARALREPKGFVLVLDEIQKLRRWSEIVKGLWDHDRAQGSKLHVILLGSTPLLMQHGLSESLAGRFLPLRVTHWSFLEMAQAFNVDLNRYIFFGGYPGAADYVSDEGLWRDYIRRALVDTTIERDVLSMARVDKPALLRRLFELSCEYSGQILAYNRMLGQMHDAGNTTTLLRYLQLLSSAGLVTGLECYSSSPVVTRASTPKLNVLNTALLTAQSGYSFAEAVADRTFWGRLVESAVGAHLVNSATSAIKVYYWREKSLEVDFVLKRGHAVIAIEVKSGTRPGRSNGMDRFRERFNPTRTLLVGGSGIPITEFLSVPAGHWFDQE